MKIAYVCLDPGVPVFGMKGCSIHCQEVMRTFLKNGWEVNLFAKRLGKNIPQDLTSIRPQVIGSKLSKDPKTRELELIENNDLIKDLLSASPNYDLVYERYSLFSYGAMDWARSNNIPSILEVNAPLIQEQKKYRSLFAESLALKIRENCLLNADSIVAVSNEVRDVINIFRGSESKVTAIRNGVNVTRFRPRQDHKAKKDIVIGFVGTLKPWHGVSTLIEAFAQAKPLVENLKLCIIGDGPEKERLIAQTSRLAPETNSAITWEGAVDSVEVPQKLQGFDIAVAPYPALDHFYFSPLKILEYMACGLPIVASRIGQIKELIIHEKSGLLVTPGSSEALKNAIVDLSRNKAKRDSLGSNARSLAVEKHSWHQVVERILSTISMDGAACESKP